MLGTFLFEDVTRIQHADPDPLPETPTGKPDNRQEFTPAVFLSYQPFPEHDLSIRAFYKRIFRMPTFNGLYYTDIGNISLHPEYTNQYNVGLYYTKTYMSGALKNLTVQADAYYNEVTDKIIAVPKGNGQYRWMMMNIGNVEIRGIDIAAQAGWQLPWQTGINTSLNYTYQKAQDFSDPADNDPRAGTWGGQISYIPWHSGSAIVNLYRKSWELNYSFIYVGERYHNSANIRENHEEPWYTQDLTLTKTFSHRHIKYKLSAEVNNLFNQQYDVILNYPMPGRNYKVIVKLEI